MMVYFLLIGFAALLVGIEFIVETQGEELRQTLLSRHAGPVTTAAEAAVYLEPLNHLRNKAMLVIAVILVVILIVMTMFMKHITEPLQHMIAAAREISGGDLSQTVRIDGNNELAELGGVINEMASNLQEIIHMSRNASASGEAFLAAMSNALPAEAATGGDPQALQTEMARFRAELDVLQGALDCFNFYAIPESRT
jgi:methyl-accepting chemotaxis protein